MATDELRDDEGGGDTAELEVRELRGRPGRSGRARTPRPAAPLGVAPLLADERVDDGMSDEVLDRLLERATPVFQKVSRSTRFLDSLTWPRAVEREFFAKGAAALPSPTYEVDSSSAADNVEALSTLVPELQGDHVVIRWLRALAESLRTSNRMLLSLGTRSFYELSREVYGGSRSTALDDDTTNLDFAEHLARRLATPASVSSPQPRDPREAAPEPRSEPERFDADELIAFLSQRLEARKPALDLELVKDDDLSAKVVCGMTRLRVREGAVFDRVEARGLYYHEIETHALTAQNGDLQQRLPFLRAGGPRSTRTQEGLAVFAELYERALSAKRLGKLVERVRLVGLAEDGASFLDLYRRALARGESPQTAYLDVRRIFRGGLVQGGAPFTKDACYLSGLIEVYNTLRVVLRHGAAHVPRLLVAGRIALDDLPALAWLYRRGVLSPPRYLPRWADRWDELLAYFAFSSFLNEVDLAPLERRFASVL